MRGMVWRSAGPNVAGGKCDERLRFAETTSGRAARVARAGSSRFEYFLGRTPALLSAQSKRASESMTTRRLGSLTLGAAMAVSASLVLGCAVVVRPPVVAAGVTVEEPGVAVDGPVFTGPGVVAIDVEPPPDERVYVYDVGFPPGVYLDGGYYWYGGYRYDHDAFINGYVAVNIREHRFADVAENRRAGVAIEQQHRAEFAKTGGKRANVQTQAHAQPPAQAHAQPHAEPPAQAHAQPQAQAQVRAQPQAAHTVAPRPAAPRPPAAAKKK